MKRLRLISIAAVIALALVLLISQTQGASAQTKFLGNIWRTGTEPLNFTRYWNQVTPENSGKWTSIEPNRDQMTTWNWLDSAYAYAKNRGIPFKEHTLIWGHSSGEPSWVCSLSAAEQQAEVVEWIQSVCQRYPDIDYIDVVNEPLHDPPCYTNALGGSGSTGWDWVIWSYQTARQYCDADLLLNDYGILNSSSNTDQYLTIINLLKSRGLIDGIGVQGHGLESFSASTIQSNLDKLAATGLPIYISEYEIDQADDAQQLQIIQSQFPVFWQHPAVHGVTLWGYVQGEIWKSNAYLVRSDGSERPAMTWLINYVGGTPPPTTPPPTTPPPTTPPPDGVCQVAYVMNQWNNGFTADVKITNNSSSAIRGWSLVWTFANGQQVTSSWNATVAQSGSTVTASNPASYWNGTIGANGGSVSFGFQATHTGTNAVPTSFTLNGVACNGGTVTPPPTTPPPTTPPPTTPPPTTPPPTTPPPTTPPPTTPPPTTPPPTTPPPTTTVPAACTVSYVNQNDWGNGATINVTIRNNGASAINGWTLTWAFPGNQQISNLWNGSYSQSGASVSVNNLGWNAIIGASGGTVSFGFNITYSGSNTAPTGFRLNGTLCQ